MTRHGRWTVLPLILLGMLAAQVGWADDLEPIQVGEPEKIEVFPTTVELKGVREQMRVVVSGHYAGGKVQDLTRAAQFATSNAQAAVVENARIKPKGDGAAEITVIVGGKEAKINVTVSNQSKPQPVSFNYGTLAALAKQGCNSGACHGSPSGKGGFRLSLRAFDPTLDRLTLIREDYGRRTNPLDPERSLMLIKPLMKAPHGGGKKLRRSDPAFAVLHDWIGEGCREDPADAAKCVGIDVNPPSGRLLRRPAHTQQLSVLARFSDGSIRDVTDLAVFTSSDTEVADVTPAGFVVGKDRGEAAIVVRYLEFIESSFITFVRDIEGYAWSNPPANNFIDENVHAKLRQLQYLPSELCADEEFLRRVYLDIIGTLPSIEETQRFFADKSADKRAKLIDELLERPEFAKFWTLKWGDLLRLTNGQVGPDGVHKYHRWVERAVDSNMPYDQFARELLTASGSTLDNPPANFYRTAKDVNDCVETISQVFLGARLQCAKCHNHPFERWTQDNYYGMAAFFNRVQRKTTRRANETFIWSATSGEVTQPRTGQVMKPWVPVLGELENANPDDRRVSFADWLTKSDNPYFAKIEANRIWSHLFGRGIVDPPDDFRDSNPPSNAALLEALAADFAKSGFDRKHVIRTILNSHTYQASFRPNKFNETDTKYFSHYQPRLLSAEQLLDAICHVTGMPESFGSLPPGTKATQLPAPDLVKNDFLKIFGQPERQTVCLCERSSESNLGMAIQFFNGPLIYNKLRADANRFRTMMATDKTPDEDIIRVLHLASVCRAPTEAELSASMKHIAAKAVEIVEENKRIEQQLVEVKAASDKTRNEVLAKLLDAKLAAIPEAIRADTKTAVLTAADKRNPVQKYLVEKLGASVVVPAEEVTKNLSEEQKKALEANTKKLAELAKQKKTPVDSRIIALEDICWALLNTNEFLFNH
ncbi:MAG: DUF1549 domain-containing protein [Pirellulaceae bacterium]|nr:DUF1549 domain-containing protein [Pirellulaceae bacterium]MDP7016796.1 DUF1549 domain-containing protein [Pirellulaceae bacterium]